MHIKVYECSIYPNTQTHTLTQQKNKWTSTLCCWLLCFAVVVILTASNLLMLVYYFFPFFNGNSKREHKKLQNYASYKFFFWIWNRYFFNFIIRYIFHTISIYFLFVFTNNALSTLSSSSYFLLCGRLLFAAHK